MHNSDTVILDPPAMNAHMKDNHSFLSKWSQKSGCRNFMVRRRQSGSSLVGDINFLVNSPGLLGQLANVMNSQILSKHRMFHVSLWVLSLAAEREAWNWSTFCLCKSLSLSSSSWNVGRHFGSLVRRKCSSHISIELWQIYNFFPHKRKE